MSNVKQVETLDFILANICHLHRTRVYQLFDALGLYQGQPPVLFELWKQEGLTQTELAARLKISSATVTRMLQRMERSGFIRREPDPVDQRVSRVFLTEAGHEIKGRVEKVWQTLESEQFDNFSPEENDQLRQLLLQLRSNLLQVTGEEPWK
jgi:MarR family transcriptional regulator, organic hydroperoxide resistance regulator